MLGPGPGDNRGVCGGMLLSAWHCTAPGPLSPSQGMSLLLQQPGLPSRLSGQPGLQHLRLPGGPVALLQSGLPQEMFSSG